MSEVKWIKLNTHMFEDEKIRIIEQMPEADTILIIWIKLLAQAGKTNASGYIFLSENIPYTEEMLATIFNRPIGVVRLALSAFERFGMIEIDNKSFISICNWEKHQNLAALEKIREDTRKRVQKHRDKQKLLGQSDVTEDVTLRNATEEERRKKKEEEDIYIPFVEIISYLNDKASKNYRPTIKKNQTPIKARWNEGFTFDDFIKVIDIKVAEWINDPKMAKFIRPETLFGNKFESYLNQENINNQSPKKEDFNLDD